MWLTYRLSDQAGSAASLGFDARGRHAEASPGQDIRNILLDLSREGPSGLFQLWRKRRLYRRELARLFIVGPYIISDVGLTRSGPSGSGSAILAPVGR